MASGQYAKGTTVAPSKTRVEIESTLERFGATAFAYGWSSDHRVAQVMFEADGRRVRFELTMPDRSERRFTVDRYGYQRPESAIRTAYDAEERRLWRALGLAIKAKLEVVASGIATFEEEFLAHVVLPDGQTVGQWAAPQLAEVYGRGEMPALLPGAGDR